ncbi:hypothetical protein REC12_15595 [Desulfosporosinus sp. PR]|uniref:hypothetical protein n=1 Tax=Candidatus Desulfosporosinus nitrosoreducens TaxID=3401928 RepID=UPI0027F01F45|nr:hypothetical protein [Desulfosporosinus sp. PR]MDQ7095020.1 hypothetical protein [Desulfosporosinus sp. PR]
MDEFSEQVSSKNVSNNHVDEAAAALDTDLNQNVRLANLDVKVNNFSKRKVLILISCLILVIIVGVVGTKYYLNFQEKQKAIASAKVALDAELKKSKAAFDSAQLELTPNSFKDAINDLKKVIPSDPNYAQAQKQITILNNVSDVNNLVKNLNNDMMKFNTSETQFENAYESLKQPTNSAAKFDYPATSTVAMSYINKADTLYSDFSAAAEEVNQFISPISNDLGAISSNDYLSSFENTNQILMNFQSITNQVTSIKVTYRNHLDSLKYNHLNFSLVSQINSSHEKVREDVNNTRQEIEALTGFGNGKINNLLEEAKKLGQ